MRKTGKRALAGVAAGALGLALIPFVGAGVASAAATGLVLTPPDAARANTATTINATFTTGLDNEILCAAALEVPAGATFADITTGALTPAGAQDVNLAVPAGSITVPGTYRIAVYQQPVATVACAPLTTQTILGTTNLVVGGAVASIAVTPTSASSSVGALNSFAVSATDSAGRPTLFGGAGVSGSGIPAQSYSLTSNASTVTFNNSVATSVVGATAGTFTAANSAAGAATISVTPNTGASAVNVSLSTVTTVAATTAQIISPVVGTVSAGATVPVGSTSVTFRLAAASAGVVGYTISGNGAAAQVTTATVPATLSTDITVPVTNSASGRTVTFTGLNASGVAVANATVTATFGPRSMGASSVELPGAVVASVGGTVTVQGTVVDNFGDPVANAAVSASVTQTGATPGPVAGTVSGSDGSFTLTYVASTVTATTQTQTVTVSAAALGGSDTATVTVGFTASGVATLSALTLAGGTPAAFTGTPAVPFDGFVDTTNSGANSGEAVLLGVTSTPAGVNVTYSSTTGRFMTAAPGGTVLWSRGTSSVTVPASTAVYFYTLKTGENDISVTAGGNTLTATVTAINQPTAARVVEVIPGTQDVAVSSVNPVRVTVKDVFGNPVPNLGANTLTATVSGVGLINGFNVSVALPATDANGQVSLTYTSESAGDGTVRVTGTGNQFTAATNGAGFIGGAVVAGAPASIPSADAKFKVGATPGEKSLLISAYRTGGNVIVDGDSLGYERGDSIKLETRKYNAKKKKWSAWKEQATVLVKKDESFSGTIAISGKVRVRAQADGVKSNSIVVGK